MKPFLVPSINTVSENLIFAAVYENKIYARLGWEKLEKPQAQGHRQAKRSNLKNSVYQF
jgi:hypothetical protein